MNLFLGKRSARLLEPARATGRFFTPLPPASRRKGGTFRTLSAFFSHHSSVEGGKDSLDLPFASSLTH